VVEAKRIHKHGGGGKPPKREPRVVTLENAGRGWDGVFTVAPLVLIGSHGESGEHAFAPNHRVTPIGDGHFGFVCRPQHGTCRNVRRQGVFTVTYPHPHQAVLASLALAKRGDDCEPLLEALPTFPAIEVDGTFLEDGYLFLECELERIVEGFGDHVLVAGRVVAVRAEEEYLRRRGRDDRDLLVRHPLLAYLHPGRFAPISMSYALLAARGLKS
jgi:flavin reductase (DIM6/NTAB) family NADH-FMN oxidoreductase RutF